MKIGILQSAGVAGDIIERVLSDSEIHELFTPVIYSKENHNDKNVGSDLRFGNIDGVVVAPGSSTEFNFEHSMTVYVSDQRRIAVAVPDKELKDVFGVLNNELLTERVKILWQSLLRDFLISTPRICVMSLNTTLDEVEKNVIGPVVSELRNQKVGVFGPYTYDDYMQQSMYKDFDATLCICDQQLKLLLDNIVPATHTKLLTGLPSVMASTEFTAEVLGDFSAADIVTEQGGEVVDALRNSVYTVIDVVKCRRQWDEAHANPLPKLYHERRDDSEKVRFAVPKTRSTEPRSFKGPQQSTTSTVNSEQLTINN